MSSKIHPLAWVTVAVLLSTGCRKNEPASSLPKPVQTYVLKVADLTEPQKFSVSLQPYSHQTFAFKVGGYVDKVATRTNERGEVHRLAAGDRVKKGEVLLALRQGDFDDQLAAAMGQNAQATAAFEKAKQDFGRALKLNEASAITGSQFEAYRASRDAAQGSLASTTAAVSQATRLREDSACIAPFDGFVIQRWVEPGDLASPGAPALALADLSVMKAVLGVPDSVLPRINVGDRIPLQSRVLQRSFPGIVTAVGLAADPVTRLFPVELQIENADFLLKPGMVATALLPGGETGSDGPAVPLAMITRHSTDAGAFAVFVVEQKGNQLTARERKVQVGALTANKLTITQGLAIGEKIVAFGLPGLRDGDLISETP